jgi:stage III sporulation protein AA
MDPEERFQSAAALLPVDLRRAVKALPDSLRGRTEEFRLRIGQPLMLSSYWGEQPLPGFTERKITGRDLLDVLEIASQASAHTALEHFKNGFLTVPGGHRLGLCGSGVVKDGAVCNLRQLSSMALRIAREVPGVAAPVLPRLFEHGRLQNTLLLSPPGGGKTTLLRDLIRCISDGRGVPPLRVGVADERGELAAMEHGQPQMELGGRTDVMDGCPKAEAMLLLLRGMTPQVLAADEITAAADIGAFEQARGCGVALLATAHGRDLDDLSARPLYRRLQNQKLFQRLVLIRAERGIRHCQVLTAEGEEVPC